MLNAIKTRVLKFVTIAFLSMLVSSLQAQKVNTVVLDAGHGGHDTGARGRYSEEKDITLAIVLKLRDQIQTYLPEVKVILTRDNDEFVELYRRARIANENKADLFISVHCNANRSRVPYGSETYVMGLHRSEANLEVAKAENASILLEDNYVTQYDGFDPTSPEGTIFFSMMQNAFLGRSLNFAGYVQKEFSKTVHTYDRGVKQAGFLVLYKTSMPSVLVESAFLSNSNEEKLLRSKLGQEEIAVAIFHALVDYKSNIEKRKILLAKPEIPLDTVQPVQKEDLAVVNDVQKDTTGMPSGTNPDVPHSSAITKEVSKESSGSTYGSTVDQKSLVYRVQYEVSPKKLSHSGEQLNQFGTLWSYRQDGLYKYTVGTLDNLQDALALRSKVMKKGYKDAFVVIFLNGNRITMEEARKITGK